LKYGVTNDQSNHFRKQEPVETVMHRTTANKQSFGTQQDKDNDQKRGQRKFEEISEQK